MVKRMIIADSGLVRKTGHHYNQDLCIKDAATRLGYEAEIYGSHRCVLAGIEPAFKDCIYDHRPSRYMCGAMDDYIRRGPLYDNVLEADIVHFPTCNHIITYGMSFLDIRAPRITAVINLPSWQEPLMAMMYQHAMLKAKDKNPQIQFMANSQAHVEQLTSISGLPVQLLESFLDKAPEPSKPNDKLVVGYFGHNNPVKGGHLLRGLAEAHPDTEFLFHENPTGSLGLKAVNLTTHQGELEPEVYLNTMNLCDIILLPYRASYYQDCISNVMLEALVMGKVTVAPNYTEIQRMGGDSCVAFDNEPDFANSVKFAIENHDALRKSALAKVKAMRAKYDVTRYLRDVIGNLA